MTTHRFLTCLLAIIALATPATAVEPFYRTEVWPEGRVLIWANPGKSGSLADARNWETERGQRAKSAPDREADIILPESDKFYDARGSRTAQVRHAIVEKGARLDGGHRNELEIGGNLKVP